jgi:hypothetical protein
MTVWAREASSVLQSKSEYHRLCNYKGSDNHAHHVDDFRIKQPCPLLLSSLSLTFCS